VDGRGERKSGQRPAIRRALVGDAAELARLLSPLGYPLTEDDVTGIWEAWETEGNFALVAEAPEPGATAPSRGPDRVKVPAALVGAITLHSMRVLHRPKPVGRITSLIVDERARGSGLGRALMAAAERALIERGCGLVEVTSHVRRTEAHTFYRHLGYERTSHRFARDLESRPAGS
jgi:GNAT superfamily N-acetyltransferase